MKLLQDFLSAKAFYLFDPGQLSLVPAPPGTFRDEATTPVHGNAQNLEGGAFVFFNDGGALVVWTAATGSVAVTSDVSAEYQADRAAKTKRFSLKRKGQVIFERVYADPVDPPMADDFTAAEEEDFDLPLFTANVLTSPDRRRFFELKWC